MSPKALTLALSALSVLAFPSAASAEPALRAFAGGIGEWIRGRGAVLEEVPPRFPGAALPAAGDPGCEAILPARERSPDRDLYCGSESLEILVSPGLITFFCNPYSLTERPPGTPAGFRFDNETIPEISLGLLGRLHERLRIGVFSTLSALSYRGDIAPPDHLEGLRDLRMHRLSLLLALVPLPGLGVGAGGGASATESSRSYDFEVLLEARLRF